MPQFITALLNTHWCQCFHWSISEIDPKRTFYVPVFNFKYYINKYSIRVSLLIWHLTSIVLVFPLYRWGDPAAEKLQTKNNCLEIISHWHAVSKSFIVIVNCLVIMCLTHYFSPTLCSPTLHWTKFTYERHTRCSYLCLFIYSLKLNTET